MGDPKKKFSNLRRCEKRLGGGPLGLCRQGFDPAPAMPRFKWELISFETFTPGFRSVARPAQAFEVRIIIGTPMSLGFDMVHGLSCYRTTITQAVLAQVIVTLKDAGSLNIPLATIAALMPALTLLVLLPAFIAVLLAISRTIGCGAWASTLAASAGYQRGHRSILT